MTIKQLEYFLTVAHLLSFSAAAKKLFISQPSLSRSIFALEEELSIKLFIRDHHKVLLTPAGAMLVSELTSLKQAFEQSMERVRQIDSGLRGAVKIGILDGQQIDGSLQAAFQYIERNLPFISVVPIRMGFQELTESLYASELDMIVTMDFEVAGKSDIELLTLDCIHNYLVVPLSHPLANSFSVSFHDFCSDTFIVVGTPQSSISATLTLETCIKAGFSPKIRSAPNIRTQLLWIEAGYGIAAFNAKHQACNTPYLKPKVMAELPDVALVIAWRKNPANPSTKPFIEIVKSFL